MLCIQIILPIFKIIFRVYNQKRCNFKAFNPVFIFSLILYFLPSLFLLQPMSNNFNGNMENNNNNNNCSGIARRTCVRAV